MTLRIIRNVHPEPAPVSTGEALSWAQQWNQDHVRPYEGCNHAPVHDAPSVPLGDLAVALRAARFVEVLGFDNETAWRLAQAGYGFTRYTEPPKACSASRVIDV